MSIFRGQWLSAIGSQRSAVVKKAAPLTPLSGGMRASGIGIPSYNSFQLSVFSFQSQEVFGNNASFTGWETSKKHFLRIGFQRLEKTTEYSKLRKIVTKNPLNRQPITDD